MTWSWSDHRDPYPDSGRALHHHCLQIAYNSPKNLTVTTLKNKIKSTIRENKRRRRQKNKCPKTLPSKQKKKKKEKQHANERPSNSNNVRKGTLSGCHSLSLSLFRFASNFSGREKRKSRGNIKPDPLRGSFR